VKVRIGIGAGQGALNAVSLGALGDDIVALGFDSIWLPEVLTTPGLDPLVALGWLAGQNPRLKLGTTMLLPGRNIVRLARQVAALDVLSGGRLLLTFVPGLNTSPERDAIGFSGSERAAVMDDALVVLRRLWAGEQVSHDGPAGRLLDTRIAPLPPQEPFDVWLGGTARSALVRCGRLADGWLPAMCTPDEAAEGRAVIEQSAADAGRTISPEHFGVSIGYARSAIDDATASRLRARAAGRQLEDIVPVGFTSLRDTLERFVAVGFSKFVLRPLIAPSSWNAELESLAGAVGDLQT
jgi:probable F420-dependent oxidoreductase